MIRIIINDILTKLPISNIQIHINVPPMVGGMSSLLSRNVYDTLLSDDRVYCQYKSFTMNKYYRALKELNPKYQEVTDLLVKIVRTSRRNAKEQKDQSLRIDDNEALELLKREYFGVDVTTGHFYVDHLPDGFEDQYLKEFTEIDLPKVTIKNTPDGYLYMYKGNSTVYVGISYDYTQRHKQHMLTETNSGTATILREEYEYSMIPFYGSRTELEELERTVIHLLTNNDKYELTNVYHNQPNKLAHKITKQYAIELGFGPILVDLPHINAIATLIIKSQKGLK